MTLVHCKEDIDAIRPYKEYELLIFPESYPAFVSFEYYDEYDASVCKMIVLEIPKYSSQQDTYIAGFNAAVNAKRKVFGESKWVGEKIT